MFLYLDMIAPSPFQWRTRDLEPMDRKYVTINLMFDCNPLLNVTVNNCFKFFHFFCLWFLKLNYSRHRKLRFFAASPLYFLFSTLSLCLSYRRSRFVIVSFILFPFLSFFSIYLPIYLYLYVFPYASPNLCLSMSLSDDPSCFSIFTILSVFHYYSTYSLARSEAHCIRESDDRWHQLITSTYKNHNCVHVSLFSVFVDSLISFFSITDVL